MALLIQLGVLSGLGMLTYVLFRLGKCLRAREASYWIESAR